MRLMDKVKKMLDGEEASEDEDTEVATGALDIKSCHEDELAKHIVRYSNTPAAVPREVLCHNCSIPSKKLEEVTRDFIIHSPYKVRATAATERPFFPKKNEVGVYVGHFQCGLTFPLDENLVKIVDYYDLPLCQFMPISIAGIVGFLHLTRLLLIPFSLTLFRLLFRPPVVSDGHTGLFARNNRKFL